VGKQTGVALLNNIILSRERKQVTEKLQSGNNGNRQPPVEAPSRPVLKHGAVRLWPILCCGRPWWRQAWSGDRLEQGAQKYDGHPAGQATCDEAGRHGI